MHIRLDARAYSGVCVCSKSLLFDQIVQGVVVCRNRTVDVEKWEWMSTSKQFDGRAHIWEYC